MYARFARKLPGFLSRRDDAEAGRRLLAERLARRPAAFLELLDRQVWAQPASPYRALLAAAHCEREDLRRLVGERGVEGALASLRDAGVRVTFEQFKGREPLVVGGRELAGGAERFRNPRARRHLESRSGGSTGAPARTFVDLDHRAERGAVLAAVRAAQGIDGLPRARVVGPLPESTDFGGALSAGGGREVVERWFAPVLSPPRTPELRFRLAHRFVVAVARLHGVRVPPPEPLPIDDAVRVARWAAETVASRGPCVVAASPSMALRIALAARAAGLDLAGVTFTTGGEPLTPAKAAGVAAAGARVFASYYMSEVGAIGQFCTRPLGSNDQHVMTDQVALVQAPRAVGGREVPALLLTSLLASSPLVLINVETDDYGVLEERRCGCPLDALGLHTHVRDVRSYAKLTAEGVTLVAADVEELLERELPARFGGTPLDYQLAEEEDERGFTRIAIRVSPAVGAIDETALAAAVLAALGRASLRADLAARLLGPAGALLVVRTAPVFGARGKLPPLARRPRAGVAA